jgi:hypothetical protein
LLLDLPNCRYGHMMIARCLLGIHLIISSHIKHSLFVSSAYPPYKSTHDTMDDSTMTDRDSSPLFMPQDEPEGNASHPKRGGKSSSGNGNGDSMGTDMIDVKSNHDTSESQPNPQEPYTQGAESMASSNGSNDQTATVPGLNIEPDVMDEQPPSPSPRLNSFTPINTPKPAPRSFSPLTSKAERKRRRAEKERAAAAAVAAANGPSSQDVARTALETSNPDTIVVARPANESPNQNVARTTPETSDPDTIVVAQRAKPATRPTSSYNADAPKPSNGPPNDTLASFALGNSSRESVGLRHLAARNTIVHKELERHRLKNATLNRTTTPGAKNPSPSTPQPTKKAAAALKVLPGARRHLDKLQTRLREEQDDACDREEHLTILLDQARDIRERAITDRENGLVIIRDRKMKLEGLEKRLKAGEEVDHGEALELLKPLDLGVPIGRETFEKMKRDGRE